MWCHQVSLWMMYVVCSRRLVDSVVKNDSSSKAAWGPEHVQGQAVAEWLDFYFSFNFSEKKNKNKKNGLLLSLNSFLWCINHQCGCYVVEWTVFLGSKPWSPSIKWVQTPPLMTSPYYFFFFSFIYSFNYLFIQLQISSDVIKLPLHVLKWGTHAIKKLKAAKYSKSTSLDENELFFRGSEEPKCLPAFHWAPQTLRGRLFDLWTEPCLQLSRFFFFSSSFFWR